MTDPPPPSWRNQLRFLVADEAEAYWHVLATLGERRRLGELEVDFEDLRAVADPGRDLRASLRQLEEWGNVAQRLEPRRIRTLEDRSVDRYKVRLGEQSAEILEFAEQGRGAGQAVDAELAQDRLRAIEGMLRRLGELLRALSSPADEKALSEAASQLRLAGREAREADRDLLEFAHAIRRQAMRRLSGPGVAALLEGLERYVRKYLVVLSEVRRRCCSLLEEIGAEPLAGPRELLQSHLDDQAREAAVMDAGPRRPASVTESLDALRRFIDPEGEMDRRCDDIEAAATDLLRRLRKHLDDIIQRSRRRDLLRLAGDCLMGPRDAGEPRDDAVDRYFEHLWMAVCPRGIASAGTPRDREDVPLPVAGARRAARPLAAFVKPPARRSATARSLAEREMQELNEFVRRAILRDAASASVLGAELRDDQDLRLLYRAVRLGRDERNPMARRLLHFRVEAPAGTQRLEALAAPRGQVHLPAFQFAWKEQRVG